MNLRVKVALYTPERTYEGLSHTVETAERATWDLLSSLRESHGAMALGQLSSGDGCTFAWVYDVTTGKRAGYFEAVEILNLFVDGFRQTTGE